MNIKLLVIVLCALITIGSTLTKTANAQVYGSSITSGYSNFRGNVTLGSNSLNNFRGYSTSIASRSSVARTSANPLATRAVSGTSHRPYTDSRIGATANYSGSTQQHISTPLSRIASTNSQMRNARLLGNYRRPRSLPIVYIPRKPYIGVNTARDRMEPLARRTRLSSMTGAMGIGTHSLSGSQFEYEPGSLAGRTFFRQREEIDAFERQEFIYGSGF